MRKKDETFVIEPKLKEKNETNCNMKVSTRMEPKVEGSF